MADAHSEIGPALPAADRFHSAARKVRDLASAATDYARAGPNRDLTHVAHLFDRMKDEIAAVRP